MRNRNKILVVVLLGAVGMWAPGALALPVEVPDFAAPPVGPFSINPIDPSASGVNLSTNLAGPPLLAYGETDPTTVPETHNVLVMSWEPIDVMEPAQAGWELVFGQDPDLTNGTISLSISPPGVGSPTGPAGGITHLEVVIVDITGRSAGGWGFNTDQAFAAIGGLPYLTLASEPVNLAPSGIAPVAPTVLPLPAPIPMPRASLAQNFMQTVNINIGAGPAWGSATITGGPVGVGPLTGPNYLIPSGGGSITLAASIQFYENGILAGNASVPANGLGPLNNYWDHIVVTPEPATMSLLAVGALAILRRKRR